MVSPDILRGANGALAQPLWLDVAVQRRDPG